MTIKLYAQPYDISATGFYFKTAEEYAGLSAKAENDYGQVVEEFEIQFIDGNRIDCALATAWNLSQVNFAAFLDAVEEWEEDRKRRYIIAVSECGSSHNDALNDPSEPDIEIYEVNSLRDLAEQFVDEGVYGPIPESLQFYIDYDTIALDLAMDFSEIEIAGEWVIYACR